LAVQSQSRKRCNGNPDEYEWSDVPRQVAKSVIRIAHFNKRGNRIQTSVERASGQDAPDMILCLHSRPGDGRAFRNLLYRYQGRRIVGFNARNELVTD